MSSLFSLTKVPWITALVAAILPPFILSEGRSTSASRPWASAETARPQDPKDATKIAWVETGKLSFRAAERVGSTLITPVSPLYFRNDGTTPVNIRPRVRLNTQKGD